MSSLRARSTDGAPSLLTMTKSSKASFGTEIRIVLAPRQFPPQSNQWFGLDLQLDDITKQTSKFTTHNETKSLLIGIHKIAITTQLFPVGGHQIEEYT